MRLRDRGCKRHNKMAKGISTIDRYTYTHCTNVHLKVCARGVLQIPMPLPQRHQGISFVNAMNTCALRYRHLKFAESGMWVA